MKFRRFCAGFMILALMFGAGCYDSRPLKESAIVMGTAISKAEGKRGYRFSVEILRAGMGPETAAGGSGEAFSPKKSVIMHIEADNPFDAARKFILFTKKRLFFNHNRIWIVSEEVARDNLNKIFDPLHRDQMMRLSSFLFITMDDPEKILTTSSMLESLTSVELAAGIQAGKYFGANLGGIDMITFYEMLSGPVRTAFVPVIGIRKMLDREVTELKGLAIIKEDKMTGFLPGEQALGLNMLRGETRGGVLKTKGIGKEDEYAVELSHLKARTRGTLKDGKLKAVIDIRARGTVATLPPDSDAQNPEVVKRLEEGVEAWVKETTESTLRKLQKEFKTDVTPVGIYMYRKYPREFNKVKDRWDEVFANGDITIRVHADVYHPGLTGKLKGSIKPRPLRNPYRFLFKGI